MGRFNAAKAQQKRERNLKKSADKKTAKSILKTNEKAKTFQCIVCKQTFLCTAREAELRDHAERRHPNKSFEECFKI